MKQSGQRIPATGLEGLIVARINEWLADRAAVLDIIQTHTSDAVTQKRLLDSLEQYLANRSELRGEDLRKFVLSIVPRIQVHADRIDLTLNPINLPRWLDQTDGDAEPSATEQSDGHFVTLTIPIRLKRVGNEMKMIVENGSRSEAPNAGLVRTLVRAHLIRDRILADKTLTLEEIAKSEGIVPSYATRLFRLTLLAPDIISAILGGKQPPELTARKLLNDIRLPLDWGEQRRSLGFA
jgi:site-specific DNA recombinase